jgi:3-(3-hydroxy-phenyl)propionate hydroxylase
MDGRLIKVFDPLPPPWDLGWPPTLTFVQPEMERLLRAALARRDNVTLMLGQTVEGFEDLGSHVSVDIADPDGGTTQTVAGDFLIGCDGANSDIRTALGFGLEDYGFDENWLVVDAHLIRDTQLPTKATQYCWPSRPATLIIGPGSLRRWELKIMPNETPEEFKDEARVREAMSAYVDTDAIEIWRSATYRFNARVGIQWRKGRVLLAGDAVHQTPPFLGQGLCAGMRDAANLAWKLVHIRRSGYNDALLESYQEERRPHVGTVIAHAKDFGAVIGELDLARARQRDAELSAQLAAGEMETKRQRFIPDLENGIIDREPGGAEPAGLAGTLMVQPKVVAPDGEEMLLDDYVPMEFLFVSDRLEPQSWMDGEDGLWNQLGGRRVVILAKDAPEPGPAPAGIDVLREVGETMSRWCNDNQGLALLVRPDRYVYAAVADQSQLKAKLSQLAETLLPQ